MCTSVSSSLLVNLTRIGILSYSNISYQVINNDTNARMNPTQRALTTVLPNTHAYTHIYARHCANCLEYERCHGSWKYSFWDTIIPNAIQKTEQLPANTAVVGKHILTDASAKNSTVIYFAYLITFSMRRVLRMLF